MTLEEMEGFFGVIINMGLIQVANLESYWSTNWISEIPFFGHVFSRNSFEQIFWLLHLYHEEPSQPTRRIDKVKTVLELLVANFQASYAPTRNLAVDETLVGFRGRFGPNSRVSDQNSDTMNIRTPIQASGYSYQLRS